jgi:hypothetical protein
MTYRDLHSKLHDHPFKPFRIKMLNNSAYDIREPWMVMVGKSSAVVATQTQKDQDGVEIATDWKTLAIAHMTEFSDLAPRSNGSRRKK